MQLLALMISAICFIHNLYLKLSALFSDQNPSFPVLNLAFASISFIFEQK